MQNRTTELTAEESDDITCTSKGAWTMSAPTIEQVEFTEEDHAEAKDMAETMGFEQYAYTSTSALWGLFCLPENPIYATEGQRTRGGCIIKTAQFGLLFVEDKEDLGLL